MFGHGTAGVVARGHGHSVKQPFKRQLVSRAQAHAGTSFERGAAAQLLGVDRAVHGHGVVLPEGPGAVRQLGQQQQARAARQHAARHAQAHVDDGAVEAVGADDGHRGLNANGGAARGARRGARSEKGGSSRQGEICR